MQMPEERSKFSRRRLLRRTLATGTAASLGPIARAAASGQPAPARRQTGITIHVAPPAGPAPLGAPVETSVPFPPGCLQRTETLAVLSPDRNPVLAQMRSGSNWPDGSIRWLILAFEAESGPGDYVLQEGTGRSATDLVTNQKGQIVADTGELVVTITESGSELISLAARGPDAAAHDILSRGCDLVLIRHDGTEFRASRAGENRRVAVEERGPLRASIRCEGQCRASGGDRLFDYILRWTVYRGRPEVLVSATWINTTDNPAEQVRDIRLSLPFHFEPDRLVIGCESGVYDGPFQKDQPVYVVQEDHDSYWTKVQNPDGRVQNLSSGACNGEHCPGWLYARNQNRCLGVLVPNFWQEYPNELALRSGELSVGLWPQHATAHLLSKPVLPSNPFGERPYSNTKYWPVMPHPYIAFVDAKTKCLDARQGMAKTQDIIISLWAGRGETPSFERKYWSRALQPERGHLDPGYVASTGAVGLLSPRNPQAFPKFEQLFDESFGWLNRHIDQMKCYGKFDCGDFKYFTAATDYMCHPGTKWGEMGEMPREGYWHNNERDTLRGLLLYYYRSGDPAAWERARIVARHLFDIDIRHHPHWGMWTHSYGHCYLGLGEGGEPDHSWLLGMIDWADISGDPVLQRWISHCGDRLAEWKADFAQSDTRSVSVYLHMMCQFYLHNGQSKFRDAATPAAEALLKLQNLNGSWPAYMGNPQQPRIEGFVEHAVVALADYYAITGDRHISDSLDRAIKYLFGERGEGKVDVGETPLALYALAVLAEKTGKDQYAVIARSVLEKLHAAWNFSSDPYGRGDPWARWVINNPDGARGTGRPPQFLGQTRPLSPSCILAYGQNCVAAIANQDHKTAFRTGA